MKVEKVYYNLEGYPCSKEYAEREYISLKQMEDHMDKIASRFIKKDVGVIIIGGTSGSVKDINISFENSQQENNKLKLFTQKWQS